MNSTCSYFLSFFWGIFILLSFIGWGSLLKNALLPDKQIDWAQRAAWGVALTIVTGGLLNICWAICAVTIWTYIGMGVVCLFLFGFQDIRAFWCNIPQRSLKIWRQDKVVFIGIALIVIWVVLCYSRWVISPLLISDDKQAYGVFPQKMLEQGSLGPDPFCDRRTSALGGQSFLHTLILSLLHNYNLHIMDPGIACIMVFGLLWGLSKTIHVPARAALLPMLLLLPMTLMFVNTTSLLMGLALFLALFRLLENKEDFAPHQTTARSLIIALVAAAICASKSNFIVFCAVFLGIFYLLRMIFQSSKKNTALECLTVFLLICIFLLPWMLSSYQSSGTLLYPALGRGYHRSAYGFSEFPPVTRALFNAIVLKKLFSASAAFLVLLYFVSLKNFSKNSIILVSAIYLSVFSGLLGMDLLMNPKGNFWYTFSFFYASLATLMMYALHEASTARRSISKKISYVVIAMSILFFQCDYLFKFPKLHFMDTSQLSDHKDTGYADAQRSIPAGETMIARCGNPGALDFKRNPVYIVDFLILGPKPGMPVFLGGEAVAKYLLSQKIRYILYAYGDFKKKWTDGSLERMRDPNESPWIRQQFLFTLKFQQDMEELGKTRKKIYSDKRMFVIDLNYKT